MELISRKRLLNIIGLSFGMLGVVIIFIYGPPQPDFNPYSYPTDDSINQEALNLRDKYDLCSKIGLGFIFVGFSLQLFAVILFNKVNKISDRKIEELNTTSKVNTNNSIKK